uniref:Receptor-type tyrosine-protein phosphatase O n=1 Tax=Schistocephalus solidus TaxID=70667 RepID=A0A0X3PCA4_SCHSO
MASTDVEQTNMLPTSQSTSYSGYETTDFLSALTSEQPYAASPPHSLSSQEWTDLTDAITEEPSPSIYENTAPSVSIKPALSSTSFPSVTPPLSPRFVPTLDVLSANHIRVSWTISNTLSGTIFALSRDENGQTNNCSCSLPCSTCILSVLRPFTYYTVAVKKCIGSICGPCSKSSSAKTWPGTPGPPENVRASPVSTTSVHVSWDSPYVTNGELENYTVLIQQPNVFTCYFVGHGSGSCTLYYLQKGTTYRMHVFACNKPNANGRGGGCGNSSATVSVFTWTGELDPTILYNMTLDVRNYVETASQIGIYLPLSEIPLATTGPLRAITLVVNTEHLNLSSESDISLPTNQRSLETGVVRRRRSAEETFGLLSGTYANKTNGSWEVIVFNDTSSLTFLSSRVFILGDGRGLPKSSHSYNGPLDPETKYSVQMRMYFLDTYSTTKSCNFKTEAKPVAPVAIMGAVFGLLVLLFLVILIWRVYRHSTDLVLIDEDPSLVRRSNQTQLILLTYFQPSSSPFYVQHPVTPIKVEYFSNYIDRLLRSPNDNVGLQFQLLNIIASHQADYYRLTKQMGELFAEQNRSSTHPPYDQSLVLLDRAWPQYKENLRTVLPSVSDYGKVYIDASYVAMCTYNCENGTAVIPNYDTLPSFIVTTSPSVNNQPKFLTMVIQQCSSLVVVLGRSALLNYPDENYWPEEKLDVFVTDEGSCEVMFMQVNNMPYWISRFLTITSSRCKHVPAWDVNQLHFIAWPVRRPPRMAAFYEFVQFYLKIFSELPANKKMGPTIIHSSAEDGREGTFICAILLLQQLRSHSDVIDVFGTVLALRKYRSDLVISKEQLGFLYSFVGYCITRENSTDYWQTEPIKSIKTPGAVTNGYCNM